MKKTISITLTFLIVAPFWITFSTIQFQKYLVKKDIKKQIINGIDKSELTLLKFSKEKADQELEWEHSREFEYLGIMYDVVESKITNDSIYYWCWKDVDETELNIKLNSLVEKSAATNSATRENTKLLYGFIYNLFYSDQNPFDFGNNKKKGTLQYYYSNFYSSIIYNPQTPPPKC